MIVVPVKKDTVTTVDGEYEVISYSNIDTKGPCVYCKDGQSTVKIYFKDISAINGVTVQLKKTRAKNVFEADEFIERKYELPDLGVTITVLNEDIERELLVKRVVLHKVDSLSSGLVFECSDPETDEVSDVTLDKIVDVSKTIFKKSGFKAYYSDYFPTEQELAP